MKSAASNTRINPMVLAIVGSPSQPVARPALGDRMADAAVDSVTSALHFVGQISQAADTVHFSDGVKKQKLRGYEKRQQFWRTIGEAHGLNNTELAMLINS